MENNIIGYGGGCLLSLLAVCFMVFVMPWLINILGPFMMKILDTYGDYIEWVESKFK